MSMYEEKPNLMTATVDAIKNANINNADKKDRKAKSLLLEESQDENIVLIQENFDNIKLIIDETMASIKSVELDTAIIDVIYSMQDVLKDTLAITKERLTR